MKRKIILGLLLQTAVLLVGGVFLAGTIGGATQHMDQALSLHHVEHLREQYLLQLKDVQSDLVLQEARRGPAADAVGTKVASMTAAIDGCFGCHHSNQATRQLERLRLQTGDYRDAVVRVSGEEETADYVRRRSLVESAFRIGDDLISQVEEMVLQTNRSLEHHTVEGRADIAWSRTVVYALVVVGPLLSALLGLIWISSLTRPFGVLLEATRRLEAGELDHRVTGLRDEFAVLEHSFNEMATSLRDQMQQMQRAEQMAVVGELAAGLVHEIKNPLAGIKNAVKLLSDEAQLSPEDADLLRKVAREVVNVEAFLKSFLSFARPARPQLVDLDVNEVVEHVIGFYLRGRSSPVDASRLVRVTRALADVPVTRADPMQLQQILLNLFLNAVDAMPEGGEVMVKTSFDGAREAVHVEVADTGRGISPEHATQLFNPFFTTKPGGTGLGLAVSKRLAEQQGGTITYAPREGGGTVFRIRLPAAPRMKRIA